MNGKNNGAFAQLHPITLLFYYLSVLSVSVITVNPVFTALTFLGAVLYYIALSDKSKLVSSLFSYLLLMFVLTLTNPIFSHHGDTPLFFMNGKPITLESLLYGGAMAVTITAVLFWCSGLTKCFTSDKIIYLFGRPFPKIALLISMTLRFIPLFKEKYKRISDCQKTLGMFSSSSFTDRVMTVIKTFSALVTWILENSIDTANSMKSRGLGLKNRTSFSLFKFTFRDGTVLLLNFVLISVVVFSAATKSTYFYFYPTVAELPTGVSAVIVYCAYAVVTLIPTFFEVKEVLIWKLLQSKI